MLPGTPIGTSAVITHLGFVQRESRCDVEAQLRLIEWFSQNADRACVHQLHFKLLVQQRGHKDDGRLASDRKQALPKLLCVTAGHLDITDDASNIRCRV